MRRTFPSSLRMKADAASGESTREIKAQIHRAREESAELEEAAKAAEKVRNDHRQQALDRRQAALETARQQCTDDALADRFARMKRRVLAHVTEIGGHQRQASRAQLQGGRGGQTL